MSRYFTGYDVGSEFVHAVTLDEKGEIAAAPKSKMHFGDPGKCLGDFLEESKGKGIRREETAFAFTGSGGKVFAEVMGALFFYDTLTIPQGADFICPSARYVFHIGARDPYFFEKARIEGDGDVRVYAEDNETGTKCGGGSGILLTAQARRIFDDSVSRDLDAQERVEQMHTLAYEAAKKATKEIDVGGRCGVFIRSDMINLSRGESLGNILKGLFERVTQNYINDVVRGRELDCLSRAVATGGVTSNDYIVEMLERRIGLKIERSEHREKVGAIGAALKARSSGLEGKLDASKIRAVRSIQRDKVLYAAPLSKYVEKVHAYPEVPSRKFGDLRVFLENGRGRLPVFMGVDGGSTTTKAFILGIEKLEPIAEICIETHGRPLQAAQNIFGQIRDYFEGRLDIRGVTYTGSSGESYHRLFTKGDGKRSADFSIDEITCHATGVRHFDERVDTICELGGQDAKFTRFNPDGTVRKAKMNLSCMAGTGQTMQNMIEMLGQNFKQFEEGALRAERTPVVDDTCSVFTEAGIAKLVSLDLPKEEIAAAVAYGFVGGYANKFVGNERFGEFISAQGGPFKNMACLTALAAHTGLEINAFPHRQLFGAYGAALEAYNETKKNGY